VRHHGPVDGPLVVFGSSTVLLAAVLAWVGRSYRPEPIPLIPSTPESFGVVAQAVGVAGALILGLGALGFGGLVLAAVGCAAFRVARVG
jgi:hypothetical protein